MSTRGKALSVPGGREEQKTGGHKCILKFGPCLPEEKLATDIRRYM